MIRTLVSVAIVVWLAAPAAASQVTIGYDLSVNTLWGSPFNVSGGPAGAGTASLTLPAVGGPTTYTLPTSSLIHWGPVTFTQMLSWNLGGDTFTGTLTWIQPGSFSGFRTTVAYATAIGLPNVPHAIALGLHCMGATCLDFGLLGSSVVAQTTTITNAMYGAFVGTGMLESVIALSAVFSPNIGGNTVPVSVLITGVEVSRTFIAPEPGSSLLIGAAAGVAVALLAVGRRRRRRA